MSKELEAYNEFLDIIDVPVKSHLLNFNDKQTLERYRVLRTQIETTLEDYQTLKKEYDFGVEHYNELLNDYNKEHKALEIIKEKFNIGLLKETCNNDLKVYQLCSSTARMYITQEVFDLLKEVLL